MAVKDRQLYLIVYAQSYLIHTQLNVYKERKPAWIASTTLPHTLSAALLNIAKYQRHMIAKYQSHMTDDEGASQQREGGNSRRDT
ncbi:MAG: hypothetical protein DLM68_18390 [Hyphomicrobiales bacterium]|nr:MAG: hypothetical protein DLM68_18390 [Hyphomicrobiales bacterium]